MTTDLKRLDAEILSCFTCGQDDVKTTKGVERLVPRVKIPKGKIRVTDSSRSPVPGKSFGEDIQYLFIGEAPGENEDDEGEPFIGKSGKYLKKRLIGELAHLKKEHCRFTNIIKCHPYQNRNPYASEIKACWTWLEAEINIIQPKVIFLVGAIATKQFLGAKLKDVHGQVYEWRGYPVMPLYHPAGVNRGVPRKTLEEDYLLIQERLENNLENGELIRPAQNNYTLVDSEDKLFSLMKRLEEVEQFSLDIETDEKEWVRKLGSVDPTTNECVGIAIGIEGEARIEAYYIPTASYKRSGVGAKDFGLRDWDDVRAVVLRLLQPHIFRCEVFIHNAKFEMMSLDKYEVKFRKVFCTMLGAYAMRQESVGLKDIIKRVFSVSMTELSEFVDLKKDPVSTVPLSKLFPYACSDAEYALRYGLKIKAEIEKGCPQFFKIITDILPWIVEEGKEGIQLDEDKLDEIRPYFRDKLDAIVLEIYELAGRELNLNSPKQKSELIFDDLRTPTDRIKLTDSGFFSTDKKELEKVAYYHPIIELIIEHGSLSTILSTFVDGLPKLAHPETGRLYAEVNQAFTNTSRFSYRKPDWQNQPVRTDLSRRIREAIIPDEVGDVIVAIDQSQIELRWAAHLSQDEWMLDVFKRGESIHKETCKFIYELDEDDPKWFSSYKDSKNGNFCRLFRGQKYKMAETLHCSVDKAQQFIKMHERLMPGFEEWCKTQIKHCIYTGEVETWAGFRRIIPEIQSSNSVMRSRGERLAINVPIQGGAQNQIQMAMGLIYKELKRRSLPIRMLLQVHDELVFSCPEDLVEDLVTIGIKHLEGCMELSLPTPVEVKVGPSWGELQSYDEWKEIV